LEDSVSQYDVTVTAYSLKTYRFSEGMARYLFEGKRVWIPSAAIQSDKRLAAFQKNFFAP
jgi:hypothetical protein